MVSPVDKNGGDIRLSPQREDVYIQVSPNGNRIAYTTSASFGDEPSNKFENEYLASRFDGTGGEGGWSNRGINAPLGRQLEYKSEAINYLHREVLAFSTDLCSEWLIDYNVTPLTPDAPQGYVNLYRQDLCGEGGFEALTKEPPPVAAAKLAYLENDAVQGFSADGSHVLLIARAGLTPDAVPGETESQIYDYSGGALHLVSVLPGGVPDPGSTTSGPEVGGGTNGKDGGSLEHAVSDDGSRVFWVSPGVKNGVGKGTLYLREHPEQGIVAGECGEAAIACTIAVSSGDEADFWAATPSGSAALYSEGPLGESGGEGKATLHRFDVETEERTTLSEHVVGVLGASQDLSRVYFVSSDVLTPGEENSAGDEALAGKPNLYLDEEGAYTFVGTLLGGGEGDVVGNEGSSEVYQIASNKLRFHAARVTPDGSLLAFESRARPTHFDNTDAVSGKADVEVFTYEAGGALHCVSCNPTGVRPSGQEMSPPFNYPQSTQVATDRRLGGRLDPHLGTAAARLQRPLRRRQPSLLQQPRRAAPRATPTAPRTSMSGRCRARAAAIERKSRLLRAERRLPLPDLLGEESLRIGILGGEHGRPRCLLHHRIEPRATGSRLDRSLRRPRRGRLPPARRPEESAKAKPVRAHRRPRAGRSPVPPPTKPRATSPRLPTVRKGKIRSQGPHACAKRTAQAPPPSSRQDQPEGRTMKRLISFHARDLPGRLPRPAGGRPGRLRPQRLRRHLHQRRRQRRDPGGLPPLRDDHLLRTQHSEEGGEAVPDGRLKDVFVEQITGLVGDTTAYPRCSTVDFVTHSPAVTPTPARSTPGRHRSASR